MVRREVHIQMLCYINNYGNIVKTDWHDILQSETDKMPERQKHNRIIRREQVNMFTFFYKL
jgi:hypothetical protein